MSENQRTTCIVLFDIEKIFDKLWQDRQTAKVKDKGFSRTRITQNYLTGRTFRIRKDETTSIERRITPQDHKD